MGSVARMSVSWNASSLLQNNPAHSGRSARPEDTVHRTYSPDSPTTRQSQRKIIVETVSAPTNLLLERRVSYHHPDGARLQRVQGRGSSCVHFRRWSQRCDLHYRRASGRVDSSDEELF